MAINTTTFEASLQTKFDATTDAKEMLLLGKALEATVGSINVSNVNAEGVTQIAAVQAAMTGALPAQAGQAGKVLTSDGTNSTWAEGLPSQTSQTGKFLTTNGTAANWQELSSAALSSDFTVETGTSVSIGTIVNFASGKVGDNPVVNGQSAMVIDANYEATAVNDSGTLYVYPITSGNDHQIRVGVAQSDGSISWNAPITVYSGHDGKSTDVKSLGGNRFGLTGAQGMGWGNTSGVAGYVVLFQLNPVTGSLDGASNALNQNGAGTGHSQNVSPSVYRMSEDKIGIHFYRRYYNSGYAYPHVNFTVPFTNSGSLSTTSAPLNLNEAKSWESVSGGKILGVRENTTIMLADWNGSTISNPSEITFDLFFSREARFYFPDTNSDYFVCAMINTSNQFVVNTYLYANSAITRTNEYVLVDSAAGVTIGTYISGTGNNLVIGYESESKGYVTTLTLDPTTKAVNGKGLDVQHNAANSAPSVFGPTDTNKYSCYFNTAGKTNSSKLTVNAYATSALNWLGASTEDASAGDSTSIITQGVAGGFTGLTAGLNYYYNTGAYDGSLTTSINNHLVGRAVSTTEVLLSV